MSFAANFAAGGDMNNVKPGLDYLGKLHKAGSVLRVLGTTPYAQFVKGEIPIWISYENDGLKAKYTDGLGDAVAVVIPKEASAAAPYGISLVKNGPNPNAGKLWLNFIMTDYGQGIFAARLCAAQSCRASSCRPAWSTSCRRRRRCGRWTCAPRRRRRPRSTPATSPPPACAEPGRRRLARCRAAPSPCWWRRPCCC